MKYTTKEIYLKAGREDKTASVSFYYNSESYVKYGRYITVVFEYTQKERQALDDFVKQETFSEQGYVRARYLGSQLPEDKILSLRTEGVNSEDISLIETFTFEKGNTFHSTETREIKTFNIKTTSLPKGGDLDWMYGFKKRLVKDGIGLNPQERAFYLAGKYYYEPDNLTDDDTREIFNASNELKKAVKWEYLTIKYHREEIDENEMKELGSLLGQKKSASFQLIDRYLIEAGSSMKKLATTNLDKAAELMEKVMHYKDRRISTSGKKAIYIDVHGFLHIYMRHVEEMQVSNHFEDKDNFQWKEENVFTVIKHVINEISDTIQEFFVTNPNGRYSRYGTQSSYFEGDYYTFHIENDGRISTFHKNKKNI